MIQYYDDKDIACFDGRSFRRDKRTGYYLASKAPRKRLHVYVWEFYNGAVPDGYHVHHKDGDKGNNEIENLELLSSEAHLRLHGAMLTDERKHEMRRNLAANAQPKAAEWHGSAAGRAWHSKHGAEAFAKRETKNYVCDNCGKGFATKNVYGDHQHRFCGNNCRAAFRRKSGVDDVDKICTICGATFRENKYYKQTKCPRCRGKKH